VIPLSGWAIVRFGVRRLWFGALVLFVAGSVLSGAAWSAGSLIFFRILQGAAGGIIMPVGQTMLAREAGPSGHPARYRHGPGLPRCSARLTAH
jgi:MFS family permease